MLGHQMNKVHESCPKNYKCNICQLFSGPGCLHVLKKSLDVNLHIQIALIHQDHFHIKRFKVKKEVFLM